MATINTAPSQVATSALESLPLENIIGAPLDACIKAQAHAAQTSARFIHEVGLQSKDDNGEYQAINVAFTFVQNGRLTRLNIPLLTIVPILTSLSKTLMWLLRQTSTLPLVLLTRLHPTQSIMQNSLVAEDGAGDCLV